MKTELTKQLAMQAFAERTDENVNKITFSNFIRMLGILRQKSSRTFWDSHEIHT